MITADEPTLFDQPFPRIPTFREATDRAAQERAAFVRSHVAQIIKKEKTAASHRTKGKLLLQRCEEIGDTAAGDDARAEYLMAERADTLAEQHYAALIGRTRIDP